jgi:hypothetical protein
MEKIGEFVGFVVMFIVAVGVYQECNPPSSYADVRDDFIAECIQGSGAPESAEGLLQGYCACVFNSVAEEVPFEEYMEADQKFRDGEGMSPKVQKVFDTAQPVCMRKYNIPQ